MAENPFAKYVPSTAPPASDNPFAKYVISTPAPQEQAVDQMPVARRSAEPFMGVGRDVGPAMSLLSPQQKREALKTGVVGSAALAIGPVVGGGLRLLAPSAEALPGARFLAPVFDRFGRAIESGGLAPNLSPVERVIGGAYSGGLSSAVVDPEQVELGATIGAATPGIAKVVKPFIAPASATPKLEQEYRAAYKAAEDVGAVVQPTQFNNLLGQIKDTAAKAQFLPNKHKKIDNALTNFGQQADLKQPVSIERIDNLRRDLNKALGSGDKTERDIAKNMLQDLDGFVRQTFPQETAKQIELARDLFTRASRSSVIDDILEKARVAKGKEPSEIIKEEFYKISQGKGRYGAVKRQFTKAEQDVIKNIGEGRFDINALESFGGMFAPPRIMRPNVRDIPKVLTQATATGLGTARFGPEVTVPLAIATGGTGFMSRAAANQLARARAAQFGAQVAAGGRAPPILAPSVFPQVLPTAAPAGVNFLSQSEVLNALSGR